MMPALRMASEPDSLPTASQSRSSRHYHDRVIMMRQPQDYFDALSWVTQLMTAVQARQLNARTPCEDFDVRSLMGHLVGTVHRGLATSRRVPTRDIPHVITDVSDAELAPTYATLSASIREAWSPLTADDAVIPPWGACAGLEAARGFTVETVTHGWDLAVATGQPSDAPNGHRRPLPLLRRHSSQTAYEASVTTLRWSPPEPSPRQNNSHTFSATRAREPLKTSSERAVHVSLYADTPVRSRGPN